MTPNGIHEIAPFGSFPFILIREGLKLRTLVNRLCQAESFVPKAVIGSENLDTCRSLVEDDYGITFLPSTLNSKVMMIKLNSILSIKTMFPSISSCSEIR